MHSATKMKVLFTIIFNGLVTTNRGPGLMHSPIIHQVIVARTINGPNYSQCDVHYLKHTSKLFSWACKPKNSPMNMIRTVAELLVLGDGSQPVVVSYNSEMNRSKLTVAILVLIVVCIPIHSSLINSSHPSH